MKKAIFILFILAIAAQLRAQSNAPMRLALISETDQAATAVDVLTAQFSSDPKIQLLERDQIGKVYREQGLSTANTDYLKLGQILGADGLLLLQTTTEGANAFLNVRLIAVKPGVVLLAEKYSWPVQNVTEWSPAFAKHLGLFLPKLTVLVKDAIPISVVNLRSAIQSADAVETERQLKLLTIQRLSREAQLFVLERQKIELLTEEKDLKVDDSAFWNGSYLLDGVVDQNGYSKETITINVRLTPPKGGAPVQFEVNGPRTNLVEAVNQLAAKVDVALKLNSTVKEWNAADEAAQYFDEAKWAMRWEIYPEAEMAAESAWALGRRNSETATLRIRAYSQSVPLQPPISTREPENVFHKEIVVLAIPDASQIEPLIRAMELFRQDARYILDGTNGANADAYTIGLQLLRRITGLLESYYYAAELRADKDSQLSELREKMRLTLATLDAYPPPPPDKLRYWDAPQQDYDWLKWEEGGLCFEQPEDALPMFRKSLEAGYHPGGLPRLVGWSWESRKRVPGLLRQFINDICSNTNPAVRLEGLYLAMVQAPVDDEGSLTKCENGLLSAMWENRQWLFYSAENISLVERVKNSLRAKYDYPYSNPNDYFDREPFAGFKHNLRLDFLAHASETNLAVFQALFPNTSEQMETPAQAGELLPLAVSYQQKYHLTPVLDVPIQHLRRVAGLAVAGPSERAKPTIPAEEVLEAKFIKWNLQRPGIDSDRRPDFRGMIVRNGKLWLRVRYLASNGVPLELQPDFQTTYIAVDPQKGVEDEIRFPDKFGTTDEPFEVSADSLFAGAQGHLYRFKFKEKTWEEIPIPLEGSSQLVWLKGDLFVARSDGLLRINPDSKEVQVLVSSRRQPSMNEIDPLWTASMWIYARTDEKLGVLSEEQCFCFDPAAGQWGIRTLPLTGTNNYFHYWSSYTSAAGAQQLLTGGVPHRYLVGYWNDNRPPESLLKEPSPFIMKDPASEQLLQPVRWDWPQIFPLEAASILAENQKLWILSPRKFWQNSNLPFAEEPVKFLDSRQATLFYFSPESRQPLSVPIHFEEDEQAVAFKLIVNGRSIDMFSPRAGGFMANFEKLSRHIGNAVFWVKTSEGLVYGAPNYCGHWLIPSSALESKMQVRSQILNQQTKTQAPGATNSDQP